MLSKGNWSLVLCISPIYILTIYSFAEQFFDFSQTEYRNSGNTEEQVKYKKNGSF